MYNSPSGLSYWASGGLRAGVTGGRASVPIHYTERESSVLDIFSEYSLKNLEYIRICLNILEYTRYFLVGQAQRSYRQGGGTDNLAHHV
jgi:hypothetical protein